MLREKPLQSVNVLSDVDIWVFKPLHVFAALTINANPDIIIK